MIRTPPRKLASLQKKQNKLLGKRDSNPGLVSLLSLISHIYRQAVALIKPQEIFQNFRPQPYQGMEEPNFDD